jgi:peroxiredoxin
MIAAMRAWLRRLAVSLALLSVVPVLAAQDVPARRSLADVQRAFAMQREQLFAGDEAPSREQELGLRRRQAGELEAFVQHEAQGDDRWEGRLMLADLQAGLRDRDAALAALRGIDHADAPGLLLLTAAQMAADLGEPELRAALVARALARDEPLDQRLQLAQVLMTRLRDVERGEDIFAKALAAAGDDAQRALVRWRRCEALREREDLPENTYYEELDELAKDLPDTYWGSVAKDRCTASQFTLGAPAIAFTAKALDGGDVALAAMHGKAVLLAFWSVLDPHSAVLAAALADLRQQHGDDLRIVGVSVDADAAEVVRLSRKLGVGFPLVCDGRGWQADLALRYHVESVPTLVVIDRKGAIAGLNLHVDTRAAREDLQAALQRALAH